MRHLAIDSGIDGSHDVRGQDALAPDIHQSCRDRVQTACGRLQLYAMRASVCTLIETPRHNRALFAKVKIRKSLIRDLGQICK